MVVNVYKEQGNSRAGVYQEVWTENRQPAGFSATRGDVEGTDAAGLGCWWQLWCHQAYQGKMLEAIVQAAEHGHRYAHMSSLSYSIWVPYGEEHSCQLPPLRKVCRRCEDVPSAVNKKHRT